MTNTYEGWTNQETWLVALYLDNDPKLYGYTCQLVEETILLHGKDSSDAIAFLADTLESSVYTEMEEFFPTPTASSSPSLLFSDLFMNAFGEINFREIANHLLAY
jgi:hypothetical protein